MKILKNLGSALKSFFKDLGHVFRKNIRDYGMYIALVTIFIFFIITTGGRFILPRNIFNLIQQTGYIAVMAVGMTLIIVIRHIDLSVGSIAGFVGAILAVLVVTFNMPVLIAIPIVIVIGLLAGLLSGYLVAKIGIPAFVATLGGMFAYKGLIFNTLQSTGTLGINDPIIKALGSGTIPSIAIIGGFHLLTIILGVVAIVLFIFSEIKTRKERIKYRFEVLSTNLFIAKLAFIGLIVMAITLLLASYKGFSWTLIIVLVVVAVYHFLTNKTVLGRHIYAVGGNPDAAELSGISVKKITYIVFGSMGLLSAMGGIMFLARLSSATFTAGEGLELSVIAAAFVGGTSAAGGVGKVTGSIIGALVMASLINGMQMMSLGSNVQNIVSGIILVSAVIFDVKTRNMKKIEV
ncbi:MAG: sugar ABC transporter permease [Candidatus Izemoplasmatales bacterium]|nr:sugar ABC transporter permease [Candidatus Izemoplasmatales bacterium]